jgi:hypothetical protein
MNKKLLFALIMLISMSFIAYANLSLINLDITARGDTYTNMSNGDSITELLLPDDEITLDFQIENDHPNKTIAGVEVLVEIADFKVEESEKIEELDSQETANIKIEIELPYDAEEGIHDIDITVDAIGEDDIKWKIKFEVPAKRRELVINKLQFTQGYVKCEPRETNLKVTLQNKGYRNVTVGMVSIMSYSLAIEEFFDNITVNSSETVIETVPVLIDKYARSGNHTLVVRSHHDDSRSEYDDMESIVLAVRDCPTDTNEVIPAASETSNTTTTAAGTPDTPSTNTTPEAEPEAADKEEEAGLPKKDLSVVQKVVIGIVALVVIILVVRLFMKSS